MNLQEIFSRAPFFFIVFFRLSGFLIAMPFFNQRIFFAFLKLAFALLLSLLVLPGTGYESWQLPGNSFVFLIFLLKEFLLGILMGLICEIFFMALDLVGNLIGFQVALSMAQVMDPTYGSQQSFLSIVLKQFGIILILITGIDHLFLATLARSFKIIPFGRFMIGETIIASLSRLVQLFLEIGLKIAFPAMVVFLTVDIVLSLISKTASKMQIFFIGLPIKVGLVMILFAFILELIRQLWLHNWLNFGAIFVQTVER